MALTPAEKQRRYRERLNAKTQSSLDAMTRALLQDVERCERGELSEAERIALADKLADLAMRYQWHAAELAQMAMKVRSEGRAWWQEEVAPTMNARHS